MTAEMKIHRDLLFVSTLLFTFALVFRVPDCLSNIARAKDALMQAVGFASLANILVGLVVAWTGFRGRSRWAWLVLFIIVWVWAFPVLVLPMLQGTIDNSLLEWFATAWRFPGSARIYTENIILVLIMVTALLLPLKSFLGGREPPEREEYPGPTKGHALK